MRIAILAVAILALSGCKSAAEKAAERYQFIKGNAAQSAELCREAGKVADLYADEKDQVKYLSWRIEQQTQCLDAGR